MASKSVTREQPQRLLTKCKKRLQLLKSSQLLRNYKSTITDRASRKQKGATRTIKDYHCSLALMYINQKARSSRFPNRITTKAALAVLALFFEDAATTFLSSPKWREKQSSRVDPQSKILPDFI